MMKVKSRKQSRKLYATSKAAEHRFLIEVLHPPVHHTSKDNSGLSKMQMLRSRACQDYSTMLSHALVHLLVKTFIYLIQNSASSIDTLPVELLATTNCNTFSRSQRTGRK